MVTNAADETQYLAQRTHTAHRRTDSSVSSDVVPFICTQASTVRPKSVQSHVWRRYYFCRHLFEQDNSSDWIFMKQGIGRLWIREKLIPLKGA